MTGGTIESQVNRTSHPTLRRLGSAALLLLGTLALLAAVLDIFLWTTVVDQSGLQARVQLARRNPAVQQAVADAIVTRVVEHASPDLVAARPLLRQIVAAGIGSSIFDPIFRQATGELHRSLFTPDQTIRLDLSDSGVLIGGVLRAYVPRVAALIPDEIPDGTLVLAAPLRAPPFLTSPDRVRLLGVLLPLLTVVLFLLAVLSAVKPRRAAGRVGLSLCLVACALAAGILIGRQIVVGAVSGQGSTATPAVGAVWDIVVGPLWTWIAVLAVAGVVLFVAAGWSPGTVASSAVRRVIAQPTSSRTAVWRAVALLALGTALLIYPRELVRIGLLVGGLFCIAWATGEILHVLEPDSHAAPTVASRPESAQPHRSRMWMVVGGIVLLGLLGLGESQLRGDGTSVVNASDVKVCEGHAQLCDRPITDVAFAATHNSMSAAAEPGWYFASQEKGIVAQLDYGIRALLIDTHYGVPNGRGRVQTDLSFEGKKRATLIREIGESAVAAAERLAGRRLGYNGPAAARRPYLCHFLCELGATSFQPALVDIRRWLESHPHEVLVLIIEDDISPADTATAFSDSGLLRLVYTHAPGAPWPTLRQMIATDKRVVVMAENNNGNGRYPWYNSAFAVTQDTPYDVRSRAGLTCALNRGAPGLPFFLLNHWIATQPPSVRNAEEINARTVLLARAEQCQRERKHLPNFVAVDFYHRGDVLAVVDALNRVPKAASS